MATYFSFPSLPEDLLKSNKVKSSKKIITPFIVNKDVNYDSTESGLVSMFEDFNNKLVKSGNPSIITSHEIFDKFYLFVYNFMKNSDKMRNKCIDVLCNSINYLIENDLNESNPNCGTSLIALKQYVFLLVWILEIGEKHSQSLAKKASVDYANTGKKSSKSKKTNKKWNWNENRYRILNSINDVLSVKSITSLWTSFNVTCEDEYFSSVSRVLSLIVCSSDAWKDSKTKEVIYSCWASFVLIYNKKTMIFDSLISLIMKNEIVALNLDDFFLVLSGEQYKASYLIENIFFEICKYSSADFQRDSTASKNTLIFISGISEKIPDVVFPHLSMLMHFFHGESYQMRNAVIVAIGNILAKSKLYDENSSKDTNNSQDINMTQENILTLRDSLLRVLLDRTRDISAYTRSKTFQVWSFLCKEHRIPIRLISTVVELAIIGIQDKTASVRRSSLQLVRDMIIYNPFGANLQLSNFRKKLEVKEKFQEQDSKKDSKNELSEDNLNELKEYKEESPNVERETAIKFFKDGINFIDLIHNCCKYANQLLGSKTSSDIHESILLFVTAQNFMLECAHEGILSMLPLIFSMEENIIGWVLDAFERIYFLKPGTDDMLLPFQIGNSLVSLLAKGTESEYTCLQEILTKFYMKKDSPLDQEVTEYLFQEIFCSEKIKVEQRCSALRILTIFGAVDSTIIKSCKENIINYCFLSNGVLDNEMPRLGYIALSKLKLCSKSKIDLISSFERIPATDEMFTKMYMPLGNSSGNCLSEKFWFAAAEQFINCIYNLADNPDFLSSEIIKQLSKEVSVVEKQGISSQKLSKLIFFVGHVSLKQVVYMEETYSELKEKQRNGNNDRNDSDEQNELATTMAEQIDAQDEQFDQILNRDLVLRNLLGSFVPVISKCITNKESSMLRNVSTLALVKYMCCSQTFCEAHLSSLVGLLDTSPDPIVRANIIISLGDLSSRFPRLVTPYTKHIYSALQDKDIRVARQSLMVLTHLILNDMVKVTGYIYLIALCLVSDRDNRLVSLARLFFHELSGKRNVLYNVIPDLVSRLSSCSEQELTETKFRSIVSFLFEFVHLDKQVESLVEKLCQRFRATKLERQWRDIAFCLSLLNYSDRSVKKLLSLFKCYEHQLVIDEIHSLFTIILGKARKSTKSDNSKISLDELEEKMKEARGLDNDNDIEDSQSNQENSLIKQENNENSEDEL